MRIPKGHAAIVGAIEAMGETAGQLEKLRLWPELTLEQRAVGYTAVLLGAPNVTIGRLSADLGLPPEAIADMLGGRGGPFDLLGNRKDGVENLTVCPSERLAYGAVV